MASTPGGMHNLTTLIKRLEAATSRLEDIAGSTNPLDPSLHAAGSSAVPRSSAAVSTLPAVSSPPPASPPNIELPRSVADFDLVLSDDLQPFVAMSNKLGGVVAEQVGYFAEAFKAQRNILLLSTKSKKPAETSPVFMDIFKDLIQGQEKVGAVREKNRKSPQENNLAMLADGVAVLFWVVQPNKPDDYVGEILGGARMYGNRILTASKDKDPAQVEWVTSFVKLCGSLKSFIKLHYSHGLIWNANGVSPDEALKELKSQSTGTAAGAPPPPPPPAGGPPPPPPPPPLPSFDFNDPSAAASPAGAAGMGSVFAEINKGDSVTSGLKKVDKSQMTHKNPALRTQAPPVPSRKDSAGSNRGKSPAPNKKPESMRTKKPPKAALDGNKWTVENYDDEPKPVTINAERQHSILISRCKKAQFVVSGKANAITVDGCQRVDVIVDTLVSAIEVINCQNFRVQVLGSLPVVQLDKVDNSSVILSPQSLHTEVYTSKCSGINVDLPPPSDADDSLECPVPEQFKSYVKDGKLVTEVVMQENS